MNTTHLGIAVGTTLFMVMLPAPAGQDKPPATPLAPLMQQIVADYRDVVSFYDLPGSPLRFTRQETTSSNGLARLQSVNFTTLTQSEKVNYLVLRNDLEAGLDEVTRERKQWQDMEALLPYRAGIASLEQARREGAPLDSQAAALQVSHLIPLVKQIRGRVELGLKAATNTVHSATNLPLVVSAPLARDAAAATTRLRASLKKWFAFHDGYRPDFSWWVRKPQEEADKALEDYAKFLNETVAGLKGKDDDPPVGEPVGEKALANAIRHEFLPYDAQALLAISDREMAWCEKEMKQAARDMGFGDDWKAALEKVKSDFVKPGEQAELVQAIGREAIAFARKHKLATLPPLCEETWTLTMTSPETLKTIPYVAYGGQKMTVAYPRDDMDFENKLMTMRGNNRHFTRTVTPHELIPGHHLQRFQAARSHPERAAFATPLNVEGWAFYCERRFWDLGWAGTPEDRVGMLFWRMTRAARVKVTLEFHLGRMTPSEMIEYFVTRVGHERLGATSEVRRFINGDFPPLYQASYLLGALQIEALRKELVDGGRMTEQDLHDAILSANAIPLELVRAELLGLPLTPEFQSSWKFAGEPARK